MNSILLLCSFNRRLPTRVTTLVSSLKRIQRYSYKPKHETSFNVRTRVDRDVTLFKFEKPTFFFTVYVFSAMQLGLFLYVGSFFYQSLKNPNFKLDSESFWGKILEKEREHSNILMPASLALAFLTFIGSWFYCHRSIRRIILHKGGREISVVTYGFPGCNRVQVPLNKISSMEPRIKAKKYIPVKIKSTPFYFLLDVTGEFVEPILFDYTAGIKRAL